MMPYLNSAMKICLFLAVLFFTTRCIIGFQGIVIVILSQPNQYHLELAENLRVDIYEQADDLNQKPPIVHLSHQDFPHVGAWTILPIISKLYNLHGSNITWLLFIEDRTKLRLKELLIALRKYDYHKEIWLGHALYDHEPTIIHHFAFYENPQNFKYPNVASGFAVSSRLLQSLNDRLKQESPSGTDFSIDSAHEFALFVWDKGEGCTIHHESAFCTVPGTNCASYPKPFQLCNKEVPTESIYFAVKTCKKFHKNRVSVVKRTWAQYAARINFFSDVRDETVPTISLGIPNTENGHCGKTIAIMKYVFEEIKNNPEVKWIVISDDDTILRMQQLLSCYDSSTPIALGERYGYNVHDRQGYNYITGGGGMVFSKPLLELLAFAGRCECPTISAPDDMYIGVCIADLGISVTHSPLFHQARPVDYAPEYLKTDDAVSFHKHWMIDPINVYEEWFADEDVKLNTATSHSHIEL